MMPCPVFPLYKHTVAISPVLISTGSSKPTKCGSRHHCCIMDGSRAHTCTWMGVPNGTCAMAVYFLHGLHTSADYVIYRELGNILTWFYHLPKLWRKETW